MISQRDELFQRLIVETLFFLVVFLLGFLGYYLFEYNLGLVHLSIGLISGFSLSLYSKIGAVAVGLMPLSIYLAIMAILIVSENLGLFSFKRSPVKKINFIIDMGPMLGVTGTMISLSKAMSYIDMSHGVQAAINEMIALVGQALHSSVWGVLLAVAAYVIRFFIKEKE